MRFLRWLFGLFGAMGLLITGVLWTGRPADGQLQNVLLSTTTYTGYSYATATIGVPQAHQLTSLNDNYIYAGQSADQQAIFLLHVSPQIAINWESQLLRVPLSGDAWQVVDSVFYVVGARPIFWSPDKHWAVYLKRDQNTIDLVARHMDTGQVINVTNGQVAWSSAYSEVPLAFSADQQWVYFQAPSGDTQHFFRARLDGGGVEDLTPHPSEYVTFEYAIPNHDRFMLWRLNGQQVAALGLFNPADGSFQPLSDAGTFALRYLPSHQLLIVGTNAGLGAIQIADGVEQWHVEANYLNPTTTFVSDDESRVYFFTNMDYLVRRIQFDGTDPTTLYTLNSSQTPMGFDPNQEILLYLQTNTSGSSSEIWRRKPNGTPQKIASFSDPIALQRPSPSPDWVIFQVQSPSEIATYRIHPDGTGLERILTGPSWWNDVVAFGPKWELKWHPPIHAILGATLLIISMLRLPKAWYRRSSASLN